MQAYDSIDKSSQSSQQRREQLSSREHIRKALKVLRDGRVSFVDLLCTVLDPTERDFERYRHALYSSPTNDSPVKLHCVLDHILKDTRGAPLFRRWMKPRFIEMMSNIVNHELDPVEEGLRGPSRTSAELDSPSSRFPSSTTHSDSRSTHTFHTSYKPPIPRPEKNNHIEVRSARIAKQMGWEEERNGGRRARKQGDAGEAVRSDEGSPEWYIRKFLNGTITPKQVSSVWVSLRGHDTGGILAQSLAQISRKSKRDPADIPLEQEIAKCLKVIFNSTSRVREAMKIPNIVTEITSALSSPHLPTRRTILEVLLSIVYCSRDSLDLVFHGLETLSQANGDSTGCYDYWFESLEGALQRGKMGSFVGASDVYKRAGGGGGALVDYALINIGLMVHIMDVMNDLDVRIHHRTLMGSAGLARIVELCREFGVAAMDKQLDELATVLEEDERCLRERHAASRLFQCEYLKCAVFTEEFFEI